LHTHSENRHEEFGTAIPEAARRPFRFMSSTTASGRRRVETLDRANLLDRRFVDSLAGWRAHAGAPRVDPEAPAKPGSALSARDLLELFESQVITRHLDLAARELRARQQGFYTIGSAGHEGNAVVGRLTRPTDPAFVHYRSGAFMAERARHRPGDVDIIRDTLRSLVAASTDPIAGGRHKVWGSAPLWVLPQTSTIASHLPKAVGTAVAIGRCRRLRVTPPVPSDSLVVASFGDASVNHSTAVGAFNAATYSRHQGLPVPILFVCEDNGLGISVPTPEDWVDTAYRGRPHLAFYQADGCDLLDAYETTRAAVEHCRRSRGPVFLHLKLTRLLGHAGSDIETEYRTLDAIEAAEARDPLLISAQRLVELGVATPQALLDLYQSVRATVREAAERAVQQPRLASAAEVMAPLAPCHPEAVMREATRADYEGERRRTFGGPDRLPERGPPRHLAVNINRALTDLLAKYPEALLFGEDVARKGGVYHVTPGLLERFGAARVFDTLLDEQAILGLAQGAGYMGLLPIPEIQYLAYVHNAVDQLRGEACSMQYFSKDQFRNPMVLRIASLGYQKGFGGHFHNDNSIAGLRDIPGLVIACPSRGDDAAGMLRTAAALTRVDGRVVAFLEPIALYMTKELHEPGDGAWQFAYPPPDQAVALGEGRVYAPDANDVLIITFGNGVYLSLRAARALQAEGIRVRVLDLRWLNPLNVELVVAHARECERVVVVDEGRRTGGLSEGIVTGLVEGLDRPPRVRRVAGADTYIPLGPAANLVLPGEADIAEAVRLAIGD